MCSLKSLRAIRIYDDNLKASSYSVFCLLLFEYYNVILTYALIDLLGSYIAGIAPIRIGICGSSMGGTAALVTAAIYDRIKALVLRSAPVKGYYQYTNQIRILS